MKDNRLKFYFFGEVGNYDCYNPAYVCNKENSPEILYLIACNEPFSISKHEIAKHLYISEEEVNDITKNLELINAVEVKDNTYRIKFPTFLEKDALKTEDFTSIIGEEIGKKIMSLEVIICKKISELECSKDYSNERILYHVICDKIFDGTAFDFFSERDLFCTSKLQPDDRNYIIVAYEESEIVEKHSEKLLCSSNNYRNSGFTFNSFGDSNGARKDMYRFLRLTQNCLENASSSNELNISYIKVLDGMNKEFVRNCGELMRNTINTHNNYNDFAPKERSLIDFLKELDYIKIEDVDKSIAINVPVFYENEETIIKDISDIILLNIFPLVRDVFDNFESKANDLTAVKHKVDIKEIANELWHQIFGSTNEYLVKEGFVESPNFIKGEGRYLRSFSINHL